VAGKITFSNKFHFVLALTTLLLTTLLLSTSVSATMNASVLRYPQAESETDSRYQYDWAVLRSAMEKTSGTFGTFQMQGSLHRMPPARVILEAQRPNSEINIFVRATNNDLEKTFLPIRIPVDRGLLGYRIFLIRASDQKKFASVKSLADLRQFSVGQGKGWADVSILNAAKFNVIEGSSYEGLFPMLKLGRFDFLSRSLDEALREYDERRIENELEVEHSLLLYYPLPRYFFVRRDAEGEQLAQRIEAGLEIMIRDGSLDRLLQKHKGALIKRARLPQRRMFRIPNPDLSPQTPLDRRELWYDPVNGK
jgi:hypothetical protein